MRGRAVASSLQANGLITQWFGTAFFDKAVRWMNLTAILSRTNAAERELLKIHKIIPRL
jgi:hypothetical protein